MEKNINAYKKAFGTMDKIKQVIMLYDTAIASLHQAKDHIEQKDVQECYNKVEKAYLIVSGLRDCIDMETGGEVAETLVEWYSATALRIITINRNYDLDLCDLCIKNLKEMRDAWVEAEKISNEEESAGQPDEGESEEVASANDSAEEEAEKSDDSEKVDSGKTNIYTQSMLEGLSISI